MSARYIVRFDDVCPTMNWSAWVRVQETLNRHGIRPIVAVVPDNRDPRLRTGPPRQDFWSVVREWQELGWTIGWHGYQHQYHTPAGGVIGIHHGSEFAGLAIDVQRQSLNAAWEIFRRNGVNPDVWVAPGHSFDMTTVRLLEDFGIRTISDGFYWRVVRKGNCVWVPQQLWRFRRMPFGVWTVCLHVNSWRERDLREFESNAEQFAGSITTVDSLLEGLVPVQSALDRMFSIFYRRAVLLKRRRATSEAH